MTFYKLLSSRTLDTKQEKAEYLLADIDYLIEVCEAMNYDYRDVKQRAESAAESIRKGETLEEEEARVVGAVYVGDAEWHNPWCTWIKNSYLRKIGLLSSGLAHHKWMRIAKKFYDVDKLDVPYYSRPSDYSFEGRPALLHTDSKRNSLMMKTGILHTEWFTYVCDQLGIEYDRELVERSKQELVEYYAGFRHELSADVKKFQHHLFSNDVEWFKFINNELDVSSYFVQSAQETYEECLKDELERPGI